MVVLVLMLHGFSHRLLDGIAIRTEQIGHLLHIGIMGPCTGQQQGLHANGQRAAVLAISASGDKRLSIAAIADQPLHYLVIERQEFDF